jgi:prepilin-type N-terminal cleavage/methylation domain-containing protein
MTRRGSTLLELLVVLVLVGFLFGIAVPALAAGPRRNTTHSVTDSLRAQAAREGRMVVGDFLIAFPDGRLLRRGAPDAR